MTPEEIKTMYMTYAKSHLKHSLDEIVPSSSSSFKKHLNTLLNEYIDKHATHFIETSSQISDFKYESAEGFVPVDISGLNNILSNTIKMAERLSGNYIQHKQLFKQAFHKEGKDGFKPLETKNTEELSDGMDRVIYRNKVKNYANSFLRSYKKLLNEDSFRLFSRIYDGDYDRDFVQKQIRKIASFKDENDLTNALTKIIESEHSVDYIKHKIEENDLNAHIIYSDENKIYVDIKDFKASQELGSSQWCISTQENFFNDYILGTSLALYETEIDDDLWNTKRGNQIFCFNFELETSDPEFAVGLTISNNGTLYAAHDNDDQDIIQDIFDEEYEVDPLIFDYIKNIKTHNPEKVIKELENDFNDLSDIYKENYLSLNYRNPLNILINFENKFLNNNGFYLFSKNKDIDFNFTIIRKSIDDLNQYQDISNNEMLNDLIQSYSILKHINKIRDKKELFIDDFIGNTSIKNHQFWECVEINHFLKKIDDLDIEINFRKNKEKIREMFIDFGDKINEELLEKDKKPISHSGHFVKNIDNEFLKKMLPYFIHDQSITKETKARLSFSCVTQSSEKVHPKVLEYFKESLKTEEIHINKILLSNHWKSLKSDLKQELVDIIQENPHIIKDISPKDMETLLVDKAFLNVSKDFVKKVKNEYASQSKDPISYEDCITIISSLSSEEKNNKLNENFLPEKINKRKKLKA